MSRFKTIILLSLVSLAAFLVSVSPAHPFTPQILALASIILIIVLIRQKQLPIISIAFIISLTVFYTGGLNSPLFFLIYFLLFTLAFGNPPSLTLAYSLVLIILLSQSLNSLTSLIPLISLVLISPLAWFIGHQYLENQALETNLSHDETSIFLWFSLSLKNLLISIGDSVSILLSNPSTTPVQKKELENIKTKTDEILKSADKLTHEIDKETD